MTLVQRKTKEATLGLARSIKLGLLAVDEVPSSSLRPHPAWIDGEGLDVTMRRKFAYWCPSAEATRRPDIRPQDRETGHTKST